MGKNTQPCPVRNYQTSGSQILGIAARKVGFRLSDELSFALTSAHFASLDATTSASAGFVIIAALRSRRKNNRTTHPAPATIQKLISR
jgi:hypothetical protein